MTVDRNTSWKHIGTVPYAIWRKRIIDAGGLTEAAQPDVWEALGDDSALGLAMLDAESSYASNFDAIPASKKNPWNLQIAGYGLSFPTIRAGALAWRQRLYDPLYKQNIYGKTVTIADLVETYAPASDGNDTERYIAKVVSNLNRNGLDPAVTAPSTTKEPIMANPIDLIQPYLVDAPVTKQWEGQGYNTGRRTIVGLAEHETQGIMTGRQRQAFFSCPNGERCGDALVDFGIPRNEKKIYRFQDPFTTNRIPWASGGTAAAITQLARRAAAQMGNPYGGVNAFYAAVEIEKNRGQPMTADQIELTARLLAYICAMNEYPADDWKYPDVLGNNVPTSVNHSDLYTSTSCRINDDDRAKFETRCTELLIAFYGEAQPAPAPTVPDILPGVDLGIAKRLFGSVKGEDGKTYSYDPNGPVSKLWTARGKVTGAWPALVAVWAYADGRRYFLFADGSAILAAGNEPVRWLMEVAA